MPKNASQAPKTRKIRTIEQLIAAMNDVSNKKIDPKSIQIVSKSLKVDVRVCGESWDKRIDYRGACLVRDIQKQVNDTYKKFSKYLPGEAPIIKVGVRKGSNVLSPDVIEVAKHALNIMGPTNITIAVVGMILCVTGVSVYKIYQGRVERTASLDTVNKALNTVVEIAKANGIDPHTAEKPIRTLANTLADEDSLRIGKRPALPAPIARQMLNIKQPRARREFFACDGSFLLCKINLKNPKHPLVLELEQDGKPINAYTDKLPNSIAKLLLDLIATNREKNLLPFPIELQLDVYCTRKSIGYGSVVALGKPRKGVRIWKLKNLPPKIHQLPMFEYIQLAEQSQLPSS